MFLRETTCRVAGDGLIQAGNEYEFRVFAVNAQGRSIPLPTDEPITPRALYDVPGKPGRPSAMDADYTFIKVN